MSGEELEHADSKGARGGDGAPGQVLAQAREAIGVSQREVADALNLPLHVIDAIEADDRDRLPANVFTRGYVRAYAKLLEIDPDPLITALAFDLADADTSPSGDAADAGSRPARSKMGISTSQLAIFGGALAGLVIVVLMVVAVFGGDDGPPAADARSTLAAAPAEEIAQPGAVAGEPAPSEVQPREIPGRETAAQRQESAARPAARPAEPAAAEEAQQSLADVAPAPVAAPDRDESRAPQPREAQPGAPAAVRAEARVEEPSLAQAEQSVRVRRLTPTGTDRIGIELSEDCWVEIKDADEMRLFADLGRAGQKLAFVGEGPFRVRLGYAPGVMLTYNSEPVALAPHTRRDVATLVVGR